MAVLPINEEKCIGCGECVHSCPMDVIRLDESRGKAVVTYPQECMCCAACEMDCPADAIYVAPHKEDPILVTWK